MDYNKKDLIVRERYAEERTYLSVDRTFLSYIRTLLTSFVVSISLFKLFSIPWSYIGGLFFITFSILLTFVGIVRSIQSNKKVRDLSLAH